MKLIILSLAVTAYLPFAHAFDASAQKLFTLSNDRDAVTSDLDFTLDSSNMVQGIAYVTDSSGKTSEKDFTLNDLGTSDGAVLEEQQGVKAIELKGKIDSKKGTGALVFHYIANGLSSEYKDCNMNVMRDSSGQWIAINAYTNQPVTAAKIITYSLGITTLDGICPAGN